MLLIFVAKCCVFFIALIVRTICLFENLEKLSILFGFSRDVFEGCARVCCVHVFLVIKMLHKKLMQSDIKQSF